MRIIFVTPEFLTKNKPSTGLPNYLYRVSKALIAMGHTPIIVTNGDNNEHVFFDGIEVYRKNTMVFDFVRPELNYIYNAISGGYRLNKIVNEICKKEKVDIIQYTSLLGLAIFCNNKIPAIVRLSSYARVSFPPNLSCTDRYVKIMSFIERLSTKRVSGIFSPSNIMAKELQKDIHRKVHVIETPFENDVKNMDESVLNEKIGQKKYILFFGSLYAEKGIFVIADIIYKILEKYPDYYFVVIGDISNMNKVSPLTTLFKKAGKYKDRIIYNRSLKHDQLYPIIKKAELILLPSLMENLSNACIEAMYFGRVVIGTDGTSFEQLITDEVSGFLALPNDSQSLMNKIDQAMSLSDNQKLDMMKRAQKRIDRLAPEIAVKKLVSYYNYIIDKNK